MYRKITLLGKLTKVASMQNLGVQERVWDLKGKPGCHPHAYFFADVNTSCLKFHFITVLEGLLLLQDSAQNFSFS